MLEERDATLMWFQVFIEWLLSMHHKATERKEMIKMCKNAYSHKTEQQYQQVRKIIYSWKSHMVIYTKYLFLSSDQQSTSHLDVASQISLQFSTMRNPCSNSKTDQEKIYVYRGHLLKKSDLNIIQHSIGQLWLMNSFLSTSLMRHVAVSFTKRNFGKDRIQSSFVIDPCTQTK